MLLSASMNRPRPERNITLYIQIGDLLTAITFAVVKNLAIDILLGTAFTI